MTFQNACRTCRLNSLLEFLGLIFFFYLRMSSSERWYFYDSPDGMRIDTLVDDLQVFCTVEVADYNGSRGIWVTDDSNEEIKMLLSELVCCGTTRDDNRITKVLSKHKLFLVPHVFRNDEIYDLIPRLAPSDSETLKVDYSVSETRLLNQFQIEIRPGDFPEGQGSLPRLLSEKFGIVDTLPIKAVSIASQRTTLTPMHLEQPGPSSSSRAAGCLVVLEYLFTHTSSLHHHK